MPFLSELRDVTVPVTIKRGGIVFILNAALERFTPEEGEYHQLRLKAVEIEFEIQGLNQQLEAGLGEIVQLSNFSAIRENLQAQARTVARQAVSDNKALNSKDRRTALRAADIEADASVTEETVNAEFERQVQECEKRIEAIRLALHGDPENSVTGATQRAQMNLAERLSYLVSSSDITDNQGQPVLSGVVEKSADQLKTDAEFFYKNFSVRLLQHMLDEVEKAIYGPLETASSSDS
jgi:hypothetical protein